MDWLGHGLGEEGGGCGCCGGWVVDWEWERESDTKMHQSKFTELG